MHKPLAITVAAAASLTILTTGTAFAQTTSRALDNEIAAGAAAAPTNSSTTRDQVVHTMSTRQGAPDAMANETAAGAAADGAKSTVTRERVQEDMRHTQTQPHDAMDTERAAWG